MGLGITNASVGAGGSAFLAYLQIATDQNAVITAINLAGDTFSGTADSTGSLVLNITEPGTYTVTETDGGVETVVIADNGETYTVEVTAFDGNMITNASVVIQNGFSAFGYSYQSYSVEAPQVSVQTLGNLEAVFVYKAGSNSSGIYRTNDYVDVNGFNYIFLYGRATTGNVSIVAIKESDQTLTVLGNIQASSGSNFTSYGYSVENLSGKYRFGILEYGAATGMYIRNFYLQ